MSTLAPRRGSDLSDIADLRLRLANMRTELTSQLAAEPILDGGLLALLGNIGTALAALEDRAADGVELAERVAISDDGKTIRLALYTGREAVAVGELEPGYAAMIAGRLVAAVSHRLWRR